MTVSFLTYRIAENTMSSELVDDLVEVIRKRGGMITPHQLSRCLQSWHDNKQTELALRTLLHEGHGTVHELPASRRGGRPSLVFKLYDRERLGKAPAKPRFAAGASKTRQRAAGEPWWFHLLKDRVPDEVYQVVKEGLTRKGRVADPRIL